MTIRERLSACLDSHRGVPHCIRCIAQELGLNPRSLYTLVSQLTWQPPAKFVRENGKCGACGKLGMVIDKAAHPMWITN
jgi:hypothetical protein